MKNEILNEIDTLSLPVPAGTKSGDPVMVGSFVGVAATDRADSTVVTYPLNRGGGNPDGYASVVIDNERAFIVDVEGAIAGPGEPVYITGTGPFTLSTTNGGSDTVFGYTIPGPDNLYATKAAAAGPACVKLTAV